MKNRVLPPPGRAFWSATTPTKIRVPAGTVTVANWSIVLPNRTLFPRLYHPFGGTLQIVSRP